MQDRQQQASAAGGSPGLQHIFDREYAGHVLFVHPDASIDLIRDPERSCAGLFVPFFALSDMYFRCNSTCGSPQGKEKYRRQHGR
jgi:hypothetical protein